MCSPRAVVRRGGHSRAGSMGRTLARAVVLGLACAATGALHSFGHLLTPSFVLIAWLWKCTPDNRWAHVAVLGLVHAAIAILVPRLLGAGASGQAQDAMSHLEERWRTFAPLTAPTAFWHEWLVPGRALGTALAPRARRAARSRLGPRGGRSAAAAHAGERAAARRGTDPAKMAPTSSRWHRPRSSPRSTCCRAASPGPASPSRSPSACTWRRLAGPPRSRRPSARVSSN